MHRDPTERELDSVRGLLTFYAHGDGTVGGMRRHLELVNQATEEGTSWWPEWFKTEEGCHHLTKAGMADLLWRAFMAARPPWRHVKGGRYLEVAQHVQREAEPGVFEVVYEGEDGRLWSRIEAVFAERFTPIDEK